MMFPLIVRSGEILGLAGVEGNGQSELVEVLTGLRKADQGHVYLDGQKSPNSSPQPLKNTGWDTFLKIAIAAA